MTVVSGRRDVVEGAALRCAVQCWAGLDGELSATWHTGSVNDRSVRTINHTRGSGVESVAAHWMGKVYRGRERKGEAFD